MKIAVYALSRNEEQHAAAWAESCEGADYRVVTDTGSTDKTPDILRAAGVSVHTGSVVPWRWDEAHNLSLHHVPADADVCVRLDLDERFKPGWRAALEKAWVPGVTKVRYWYNWLLNTDGTPSVRFPADRAHLRSGYRWVGATHEGLVRWHGDELAVFTPELEIDHYRAAGKKHSTDLALLQQAVKEMPHDARMQWYFARQLDYEQQPTARAAFEKYLTMPDGSAPERAYACRVLARLAPEKATTWLEKAIQESPAEPEAYFELAKIAHEKKDALAALFWASRATACSPEARNHTSDSSAYGPVPPDMAAVNAFLLGLNNQCLYYTKEALRRKPDDPRLQENLAKIQGQKSD